jgi:hypothetical protein
MNARAQGAPPAATPDRSAALAGAWIGLAIVLVLALDTAVDPGEADDRVQRPEEQDAIAGARGRVAGWLRFQEDLLAHVVPES